MMNESSDQTALQKASAAYLAQRKAGLIHIKSPAQKASEKPTSLRLAINAKCWDCTCRQKPEVTRCEMVDCSLWTVRPWQNDEINAKILEKNQ